MPNTGKTKPNLSKPNKGLKHQAQVKQNMTNRGKATFTGSKNSNNANRKMKKPKKKHTALKNLEKKFDKRDQNNCVGPVTAIRQQHGDYEGSWGRILDVIDAHIKRAVQTNPQVFLYDYEGGTTESPPTIQFSHMRSLWVLICQHYLYRAGVLSSTSPEQATFKPPSRRLPVTIAKVIQQYAPYYDVATGSTFRPSVSVYPTSAVVFWDYPSVDAASTTQWNFNTPRRWCFSHPSLIQTTKQTDFCIFDQQTSGKLLGNSSSVYTNVTAMSAAELAAIESLFPTVDVDTIALSAPDSSLYSFCTPNGITNPTPNFDPSMSIMIGKYNDTGDSPDEIYSYPFCKSPPVVRAKKDLVQDVDYSWNEGYRYVIYGVYAYLGTQVGRWTNTKWQHLLRGTPFKSVKHLSFHGTPVNSILIADAIGQLIGNCSFTGTPSVDSNRIWGVVTTLWQMFARRTAKYDVILDCQNTINGVIPSLYNGFTSNSLFDTLAVPGSLIPALSTIGPLIVNGELYFPYWATSIGSAMQSISSTGLWSPTITSLTAAPLGSVTQNNVNNTLQISNNTGGNFTYDSDYKYGQNFESLAPLLKSLYIDGLGQGIPYNQGLPPPLSELGNVAMMLSPTRYEISNYAYLNTAKNGWYINYAIQRTGCTPFVCTTGTDASMITCFSVFGLQQDPTGVLFPCRYTSAGSITDSFSTLQTSLTGTPGANQYSSMSQAIGEGNQKQGIRYTKEGAIAKNSDKNRIVRNNDSAIRLSSNMSVQTKRHKHKANLLDNLQHIVKDVSKGASFVGKMVDLLETPVTLLQASITGSNPIAQAATHTITHTALPMLLAA